MGFALIAHRGFSSQAPENTLSSLDLAVEHGYRNIETDCQLTEDSIAFVVHDEQLGRVNNGVGTVAQASAAYIRTLNAGSWFGPNFEAERIPALEEVLERYRGRIHLHLELKSAQPELPHVVAKHIQASGWSMYASCNVASAVNVSAENAVQGSGDGTPFAVPGLTITSFHLRQLKATRQLLPGVRLGWLVHQLDQSSIQAAMLADVQQICPRANILTAEGVASARAAGLIVRAWGIKTVELLHHAVACGAHGATVNWPDIAHKALNE